VPEGAAETIITSLITQLRAKWVGDGGTTYWYTPAASPSGIIRVPSWQAWDRDWFDKGRVSSGQALAIIRILGEQVVEHVAQSLDKTLELMILVATPFTPNTQNPYAQNAPIEQTIQTRLKHDLEKAVLADVTLGAQAINANTATVDWLFELGLDDWAIVGTRMRVLYNVYYLTP